jgi:hypothetical protein
VQDDVRIDHVVVAAERRELADGAGGPALLLDPPQLLVGPGIDLLAGWPRLLEPLVEQVLQRACVLLLRDRLRDIGGGGRSPAFGDRPLGPKDERVRQAEVIFLVVPRSCRGLVVVVVVMAPAWIA